MKLAGKVAVVIPGTYGIGHDAAVRFAEEGARVVVGGADEENGRKTVAAVARAGGSAEFVSCNLFVEKDIERTVAAAIERYGALDVAFGCPDYYTNGTLTEQSAEVLDATLGYNCRSLFFLAKHAIPAMISRAGGSLIFLTSMYAFVAGSASCAYEIASGAVVSLARGLADRYAERRVRVNCIAAGHVIEPPRDLRMEVPTNAVRDETEIERLSRFYPVGRLALPGEIARAAVFLASDDSSYATGTTLSVEGGFVCR